MWPRPLHGPILPGSQDQDTKQHGLMAALLRSSGFLSSTLAWPVGNFFHPKRNKSGVWLTGIHQKTEDRRNSSHILDFNFLRGTSERQDDERSSREICLIPIRYGEEAGLFNKEWEGQGGWRVGGSQKECGHWLVVGSWSNCRRMSPCRDTRWNPHCPHFP